MSPHPVSVRSKIIYYFAGMWNNDAALSDICLIDNSHCIQSAKAHGLFFVRVGLKKEPQRAAECAAALRPMSARGWV